MTSNQPETAPVTESAPRLLKIEKLPNLYRLLLPGDKPNKPTGFYYAAIKRGRKQFRRSLKTADRNTPLLLPPDRRDWVAEDDLVHFVIQVVERLPLSAFAVNHKGCGDEQYSPHTLLALLIYCYANGVFSARRIERATCRDVAVRCLTADTHPDHDTICAFRRNNLAAIATAFVDVLELAREPKLLKLGTVSLDGMRIHSSAPSTG